MGTLVADEYADIARRHMELFGGSPLPVQAEAKIRWAIWFEPGDRQPGWCRIDSVTGKWGLSRSAADSDPTFWNTELEAIQAIDGKTRGAWSNEDMRARVFGGW